MPVSLPPSFAITPLSIDVFGPARRQLIGRIEECTFGIERRLGRFLVTDRCLEAFSHPTMFDDELFAARTGGWVRVAPDPGLIPPVLHMQPWDHVEGVLGGAGIREAAPVAVGCVSVDAVILLVEEIARFGGRCANPACEGAEDCLLDPRRTVLIENRGRGLPICGHCYVREAERVPGLAARVIIDGRRLPARAPVAYLSQP